MKNRGEYWEGFIVGGIGVFIGDKLYEAFPWVDWVVQYFGG